MILTLTKRLVAILAVCALFVAPAQAQDGEMADADIVETAMNADGFDTLVAALKAADLVEALKGEGPFTVFAPTDEAFAALPEGTLENLLKPENKDQLAAILTYHVVAANAPASAVTGMSEAKTLNGAMVQINTEDGVKLMGANTATVTQTDIMASNGVIHVIDTVLMPPKDDSDEDMDSDM